MTTIKTLEDLSSKIQDENWILIKSKIDVNDADYIYGLGLINKQNFKKIVSFLEENITKEICIDFGDNGESEINYKRIIKDCLFFDIEPGFALRLISTIFGDNIMEIDNIKYYSFGNCALEYCNNQYLE